MKADDSYITEIFTSICNNFEQQQKSQELETESDATNNLDLDIFDKNEANGFGEPLKIIFDAKVVFKNSFKSLFKEAIFTDFQRK